MPSALDDTVLKSAVKALSALPPPDKPDGIYDTALTTTCICGKEVPITQLKQINTGAFICASNCCKGCKRGEEYERTHARFVCSVCKRTVLYVKPSEDKTGFKILPGKSYHVLGCGMCNPEKKEIESKLIEKTLWNRAHGIAPQKSLLTH